MRIRTIKPSFFLDDDVACLQPLTRLLFVGLWCMADVAGRLEDRPRRIKVALLPYDNHDVDGALHDLEAAGFIHRYKAEGKRIIQVINFEKHQRITGKEAETQSALPEFTGETPEKHPGSNGETLGMTGREGKGKEGNKEGNGGGAGESAPASAVATPSKEPVRCPDTNGQEKPQGDAIPLNGEPSTTPETPDEKPPRKRFVPPTEAELLLLGAKIGLPETEVRKFLTYYESNGWRVGRNPMKSVPHALSHWKLRWQEHSRAHRSDFERGF